jgi:hypothetical protein
MATGRQVQQAATGADTRERDCKRQIFGQLLSEQQLVAPTSARFTDRCPQG